MSVRTLREGETPQELVREGYNRCADKYHAFTLRIKSPRLEWLAKLYALLSSRIESETLTTSLRTLEETSTTDEKTTKASILPAHVLELGCGTGSPCTLDVAQNVASLVATDLSSAQLAIARQSLIEAGCHVTYENRLQDVIKQDMAKAVDDTGRGENSSILHQQSETIKETNETEENGRHVHLIEADMLCLSLSASTFDAVCAFYSLQSLPIPDQITMLHKIYSWLKPGGFLLFNCAAEPSEGLVMEGWLGMDAYTAGLGEERARRVAIEIGFEIVDMWTGRMEVKESFTWILAQKPAAITP